ncbi:MAG: hypothetical protein WBA76_00120 [Phormidesmis sp.]
MKLAIRTRSISLIGCGILLSGALAACTLSEVDSNTPTSEASGVKSDTSKSEKGVRLPVIGLANRSTVPINSLTADQAETTVAIAGTVMQQAPLLAEAWLYKVSDDSGSVWVVSDRPSPAVGETVTLEGTVRYEDIVVGEINAGEVYLQQQSSGLFNGPADDSQSGGQG